MCSIYCNTSPDIQSVTYQQHRIPAQPPQVERRKRQRTLSCNAPYHSAMLDPRRRLKHLCVELLRLHEGRFFAKRLHLLGLTLYKRSRLLRETACMLAWSLHCYGVPQHLNSERVAVLSLLLPYHPLADIISVWSGFRWDGLEQYTWRQRSPGSGGRQYYAPCCFGRCQAEHIPLTVLSNCSSTGTPK